MYKTLFLRRDPDSGNLEAVFPSYLRKGDMLSGFKGVDVCVESVTRLVLPQCDTLCSQHHPIRVVRQAFRYGGMIALHTVTEPTEGGSPRAASLTVILRSAWFGTQDLWTSNNWIQSRRFGTPYKFYLALLESPSRIRMAV